MARQDMKMSMLNDGIDSVREENLNTIHKIVQVIIQTAQRYIRENKIEKGKEITEGLDKFRLGHLSLEDLHNLLLDKDKCVGEVTEIIELYVPAYLIRVDGGKFPFFIPKLPVIRQSPVQEADTLQASAENNHNDSFNNTVVVVPKTQPDTPNGRKLTSYDDIMHITFIKLDVLSRYPFKYVNLLGQAISVFKTKKGSIFVRYWDGSAHKANQRSFSLFLAEEDMIESFSTTPRTNLADIPPTHYIDIEVYGEYIPIAQSIRSGDVIAIVNLHVYKNRVLCREFQATLHEGGKNYARDLFILNEEERSVEDMKRKFYDIAEKEDLGRPHESRMKTFFKTAEKNTPSKIRHINSNDNTDSGPMVNNKPTSSAIRTAHEALNNQGDNLAPPLKRPEEPITKETCVILSDESDSDEIILNKKTRSTSEENARRDASETHYSPIKQPEKVESTAVSRGGSVRENEQRSPVVQNGERRLIPMKMDLKEFFRQRVKSSDKNSTRTVVIKYIPNERLAPVAETSVADTSVQVGPKQRSVNAQTERKKSKNVGIQTSPVNVSIGVQTSPMKSPVMQPPGKEVGSRKRKLNAGVSTETTTNTARNRTSSKVSEPRAKQSASDGIVTRARSKKMKPIKSEIVTLTSNSSVSTVQNVNLTETESQDVILHLTPKRTRGYKSVGATPPRPPVRSYSLGLRNVNQKNHDIQEEQRPDTAPRLPPHRKNPQNVHKTPEKYQMATTRNSGRHTTKATNVFPISTIGSTINEEKPPIRNTTKDSTKEMKPITRSTTGRIEEKPNINHVLVSPQLHAMVVRNNKRRGENFTTVQIKKE